MTGEFEYHDHWNTFSNGTNYGSDTVVPSADLAITNEQGEKQPVEGVNTAGPVRSFTGDALKTLVVPLDGATNWSRAYLSE